MFYQIFLLPQVKQYLYTYIYIYIYIPLQIAK